MNASGRAWIGLLSRRCLCQLLMEPCVVVLVSPVSFAYDAFIVCWWYSLRLGQHCQPCKRGPSASLSVTWP